MARAKKQVKDIAFALRLPPSVYQQVKAAAEQQDDSINALLVRVIARAYPPKDDRQAA